MSEEGSGILLILCGPAGSGKTTLCEALAKKYPEVVRFVTTTTRAPRPGEVEGVDYHFIDPETFEREKEAGAFLEWAEVHGRFYGTPKAQVMRQLESGQDLLFNIDVQGAESYRQAAREEPKIAQALHTVFIDIPDLSVIQQRLEKRGDSPGEIARRIETARKEMLEKDRFDIVFETGTKEEDFAQLEAIYRKLKKLD
jgi:guanylate kinase